MFVYSEYKWKFSFFKLGKYFRFLTWFLQLPQCTNVRRTRRCDFCLARSMHNPEETYLARCPEKEEVFTSAFYLCEPILIFSWIKLSNSAGSNLVSDQQNANNYARVPVKYSIDDSWTVTERANACCQVFCALEAAKPIYINSHLYQTKPPSLSQCPAELYRFSY